MNIVLVNVLLKRIILQKYYYADKTRKKNIIVLVGFFALIFYALIGVCLTIISKRETTNILVKSAEGFFKESSTGPINKNMNAN